LQHADPFVRGESALALGWMGPVARSAVPFLAQAVRGPRSAARQLDPEDTPGGVSGTATPPVLAPVNDGATAEENCRVYAAQALGRIGPAAAPAVSDLLDAARGGPESLRQAARQAVRLIQGQ